MKHSGLSKNEILAIFTEGYGPTVTLGCPSDNFVMVYEPKGNTTFGKMGDTWGERQKFIESDNITINKDVFYDPISVLNYSELTTPNIPSHHTFFLGVMFLHELVHFGDTRVDGVQNNTNFSSLNEYDQVSLKEITRNLDYPASLVKNFQNGIEPGKAFEYELTGWEVNFGNSKESLKSFKSKSENSKSEHSTNKKSSGSGIYYEMKGEGESDLLK